METVNEIFFHEDDYCLIELLPQNPQFNQAQIDLSLEEYLHYKDISTLRNLKIKDQLFEVILKREALFRFDCVYSGYSTERLLQNNNYAYGYENYVIFYHQEGGIIRKCWICYNSIANNFNKIPTTLKKVLIEIGLNFDLILIDWTKCKKIVLKAIFVNEYLDVFFS